MGDHMLIIERYHEVCDEAIVKMQRKHGPIPQRVLDWIDGNLDRIRSHSAYLRGRHDSVHMTEEQYQSVQSHNEAKRCGGPNCTGDVIGTYLAWDWDENNNRVCAKYGELLEGRYR